MNANEAKVETVPLAEHEVEHLAPILERYQAAQKDWAAVQSEINAVIKLFGAYHKSELTGGVEQWQLHRDCFVRQVPPAPASTPPQPTSKKKAAAKNKQSGSEFTSNDDDTPNGAVEDVVAELMQE